MQKLIIIHDEDVDLYALMAIQIVHCIRCPRLMHVAGEPSDPPDQAAHDLHEYAKKLDNDEECRFVLLANNKKMYMNAEVYRKHFDVFSIFTDMTEFAANGTHHGVWLGSPDEIRYAFNQIVGWIYDV